MNEYSEGDKLTFERGTSRIVAKVTSGSVSVCFESLPGSADVKWMTDMGWGVVSVEKAAPKLPTEPGYYRVSGMDAEPGGTLQLDTRGQWWWVGNKYRPSPEALESDRLFVYLPLTRLEPVPVTAKKVLDALKSASIHESGGRDSAHRTIYDENWDAVAAEFGVTA